VLDEDREVLAIVDRRVLMGRRMRPIEVRAIKGSPGLAHPPDLAAMKRAEGRHLAAIAVGLLVK
jgi:hypothetical protein